MTNLQDQYKTGPFLDRLFSFVLPSRRLVAVRGFHVRPTNLGIMEGGLAPQFNDRKRDEFIQEARALFGAPLFVLEPIITPLPEISHPKRPRERLPWMACAARLISDPLDADMTESWLTLVWWQDAFTLPLPQEIERAAQQVTWEEVAQDWDFS
jgi:hypothetical protein